MLVGVEQQQLLLLLLVVQLMLLLGWQGHEVEQQHL
jgi:hypothetical protein